MSPRQAKKWNGDVKKSIKGLDPTKKWLKKWIDNAYTDWESQKSAHQALRLLEMAQYEMWNMQYWQNSKEQKLYSAAETLVAR